MFLHTTNIASRIHRSPFTIPMLFSDRRRRLLYILLAAMDVAWLLPIALLALATQSRLEIAADFSVLDRSPLLLFVIYLVAYLLLLLSLDLLNARRVASPFYEIALLASALLIGLLALRITLYPDTPLLDFAWFDNLRLALLEFTQARRPELVLSALFGAIALRAANASSRALAFFDVGVTFRFGLLALLIGGALLSSTDEVSGSAALTCLWIFLASGLGAVSLARTDDKATHRQEELAGATLPWPRLTQLAAAIGITLLASVALSALFTPEHIRTALGWFPWLWRALSWLLIAIVTALFWLLTPLLNWLVRAMAELVAYLPESQEGEEGAPLIDFGDVEYVPFGEYVRNVPTLRYAIVAAVVLVTLLLIWIYIDRRRARRLREAQENASRERVEVDGAWLRRGLDRLRDWANLARRYGAGGELLSAISVQNLYANVSRLARRLGHPRSAAQPPLAYLDELMRAFPERRAELTRLTHAYMRVHYGDRALEQSELEQLRADYAVLRSDAEQAKRSR